MPYTAVHLPYTCCTLLVPPWVIPAVRQSVLTPYSLPYSPNLPYRPPYYPWCTGLLPSIRTYFRTNLLYRSVHQAYAPWLDHSVHRSPPTATPPYTDVLALRTPWHTASNQGHTCRTVLDTVV